MSAILTNTLLPLDAAQPPTETATFALG